jgi:hypothetical protein
MGLELPLPTLSYGLTAACLFQRFFAILQLHRDIPGVVGEQEIGHTSGVPFKQLASPCSSRIWAEIVHITLISYSKSYNVT